MPSKDPQTAYSPDVQHFIKSFLNPPIGKSPEALTAKLIHWVTLAKNPEIKTSDTADAKATAQVRRRARQNAIRLIQRHPFLIDAYTAHHKAMLNGGAL